MKRENRQVNYSYEHGDESLPYLKDLVSETPDPDKSKIVAYLKTHCILACPGRKYDEITPGKVIGSGHIFSDGVYYWNDQFTNYVNRYNIPVPQEFRQHILKNYNYRMKRHVLLRLVDCVELENNTYPGYQYKVSINKDGIIKYQNNTDCKDETYLSIKPDDAAYIINPIMSELFCYDADEHGKPVIDGYHWKLTFYRKGQLVDEIEGWPGEDKWRHGRIKGIVVFAERYIPKNLGSNYMDLDTTLTEDNG